MDHSEEPRFGSDKVQETMIIYKAIHPIFLKTASKEEV